MSPADMAMEGKPLPLSQETLAQFNQVAAAEDSGTRPRAASFSTRRSSQSIDIPPRSLMRMKSIEGRPMVVSRRNSIMSNFNVPFSRKNSISMPMGKRLSMGPWMHYGRVSFCGLPLNQPIREIQYENTYKTQPDEGCRFNVCRVQRVLESTLAGHLGDAKYNAATTGQLSQSLSDLIRSKLKEHCSPRYKLVCNVILGQMGGQGVRAASRALWDNENDNFASATFTNTSLFAIATVHGLYFE
ncbi:dynein light chain Tctex-type 4 isoform X2 [Ambystoma mexicanum]